MSARVKLENGGNGFCDSASCISKLGSTDKTKQMFLGLYRRFNDS